MASQKFQDAALAGDRTAREETTQARERAETKARKISQAADSLVAGLGAVEQLPGLNKSFSFRRNPGTDSVYIGMSTYESPDSIHGLWIQESDADIRIIMVGKDNKAKHKYGTTEDDIAAIVMAVAKSARLKEEAQHPVEFKPVPQPVTPAAAAKFKSAALDGIQEARDEITLAQDKAQKTAQMISGSVDRLFYGLDSVEQTGSLIKSFSLHRNPNCHHVDPVYIGLSTFDAPAHIRGILIEEANSCVYINTIDSYIHVKRVGAATEDNIADVVRVVANQAWLKHQSLFPDESAPATPQTAPIAAGPSAAEMRDAVRKMQAVIAASPHAAGRAKVMNRPREI